MLNTGYSEKDMEACLPVRCFWKARAQSRKGLSFMSQTLEKFCWDKTFENIV